MTSLDLSRVRRVRLLLASAALAASLALTGCQVEGPYSIAKHMRPLSSEMISLLERKGMSKSSPLLVRIFKEEAELEVWKQDSAGQFALLKTYPICRWSGQLGPKTREGDRQAPEGFYAITPGAMNPNSSFYLSFNLGYPNAFDRAHGRTGAHLMVHGDCSSRGCYSMTDEQIAEIFALGREAFFAGQKSFQVQAYPFRMTALNMAKHRNSPHLSFWKNLKEGYDHFELTRQEPKVDVCEKRYVFNAQSRSGSATPLAFEPAGRCPAYEVPQEIATRVNDKARRDQQAFADFVRRGTQTVPVNTGRDGGMHRSFAALYETREVRDSRGNVQGVAVERRAAPIGPADYNPPPEPEQTQTQVAAVGSGVGVTGGIPMPRPAPWRDRAVAAGSTAAAATSATAYARTSGPGSGAGTHSGSFLGNLYSRSVGRAASAVGSVFGFGGAEAAKTEPKQKARLRRASRPTPKNPPPETTASTPAPAPRSASQTAAAAPGPGASSAANVMTGAQPVVPASNFEQRWQGAFR